MRVFFTDGEVRDVDLTPALDRPLFAPLRDPKVFASAHWPRYDCCMAVTVQKLKLGQEVEVEGRLYEVVSDHEGGVTLEPAITLSVGEIHKLTGGRPATPAEIEEWFGDIPSDGEG